MKNQTLMLFGLICAVLDDVSHTYPELVKHCSNCKLAIERALRNRGVTFLTITLPECGKYLDKSLGANRLLPERPPYHGRYSELDTRPVFLHKLWARLFDDQGQLLAVPDESALFYLRQVYYLVKKLNAPCAQEYVDASVREYIDIETELPRSWPNTWDSDVPEWSRRSGHPLYGEPAADDARQHHLFGLNQPEDAFKNHWGLFDRLCRSVSTSFGPLDVWAIRPKHGPGVVSDSERGSIKFDFRHWPDKLNQVFPADYFSSHDFVARQKTSKETPSKLIAVPKTAKGPRLIAAEPTAHQWIQGGIQRWLEDAVRSSPISLSIDFKDQEYSRQLALEASATGAYATVDLSSASDRLSTRLVEYVFQGNQSLLDALHASRSRSVLIPPELAPGGSAVTLLLRKFAAMGSAVTFPVQTIVFTLISQFALMLTNGDKDCSLEAIRRRASKVRVFGDDIIIETSAYPILRDLLSSLGLKVNEGKSFHDGYFREACGMDAFNGVDVTPAYLRSTYEPSNPESLESVVAASNNFYMKGLWRAAAFIQKTVETAEPDGIVVANRDIGPVTLFTFGKPRLPPKWRWNRSLHRVEYLCLVLSQQTGKRRGTGEASLLQYFIDEPSTNWWESNLRTDWSAGQATRPKTKKRLRWVPINL